MEHMPHPRSQLETARLLMVAFLGAPMLAVGVAVLVWEALDLRPDSYLEWETAPAIAAGLAVAFVSSLLVARHYRPGASQPQLGIAAASVLWTPVLAAFVAVAVIVPVVAIGVLLVTLYLVWPALFPEPERLED